EPSAGSFTRLERQFRHLQEIRTSLESSHSVEPREVRVEAEAGKDRLEALELSHNGLEGPLRFRLGFKEALDACAHRPEDVPFHHEVFVVVSGARVTTWTDGAGAADVAVAAAHACCSFFTAAISFFRLARASR